MWPVIKLHCDRVDLKCLMAVSAFSSSQLDHAVFAFSVSIRYGRIPLQYLDHGEFFCSGIVLVCLFVHYTPE